MTTKEWHIYNAHKLGIMHGNLPFWIGMAKEVIPPHTGQEAILDYGCASGEFLRMYHYHRPFQEGLGVDIDSSLIKVARDQKAADEPIKYGAPEELERIDSHFDLAFTQEVFWMIEDLPSLAKTIHRVLKPGGEYYVTMGCHIENPLWMHRRRLLQNEGYSVYDYSVDEVADIFHNVGFEVGLKRLITPYFQIFDPDFTRNRAQSLSRLVETTAEHKMLFYFRKDDD